MTKLRLVHRCTECGASHAKWSGRCASCASWNTLVEEVESDEQEPALAAGFAHAAPAVPVLLEEVDVAGAAAVSSGIDELDRVLGGGLVPGSVTLLGGEPGVGKSTLLLQLLAGWPGRCLYVSAEESAQQVRQRAERVGAVRPDVWLLAETSLSHILAALDELCPALVVVDSIQTVADPSLASAPGSVAQVRGCAAALVAHAKRSGAAVVLVGHVTKEGSLAGPRVLEHVVDTVLGFEGDRHHALRLLRASKHRFGPTSELGLFEMQEVGLAGVPDASMLFLADRRTGVPGSTVVATLEGHRPLLVEVQALAAPVPPGVPPRRSTQGLDPGRLAMLLAVLDRRAGVPAEQQEIFASVAGGVRLTDPGTDLAVSVAVASALLGRAVPADVAVFGEVGLAGEVRHVGHAARRLGEAARLGFRRAIVPHSVPESSTTLRVERVRSLAEALTAAGLVGARPSIGGRPLAATS